VSANPLKRSSCTRETKIPAIPTWQRTQFLLPCFDIEVSPSGTVYMLGQDSDQEYWNKMSIYRKGDQQWSWTEQPVPEAHCDSRIAIDDDEHLWVTSMSGLELSVDRGAGWFSYTTQDGLASEYIHGVYVQGSGASKRIWVGTAMGASRGMLE
jgi:ligand-binding sensor domain-containing protein